MSAQLTWRPATAADQPWLLALFAEDRSVELATAGLDEAGRTVLLELQFRAQTAQYRALHPDSTDSVLLLDDVVVGRCWVARTPDELRVLDLIVSVPQRRQGIARRVMEQLQAEAAARRTPLRLSVWGPNEAARALYAGVGFEALHGGVEAHERGGYEQLEWRDSDVYARA